MSVKLTIFDRGPHDDHARSWRRSSMSVRTEMNTQTGLPLRLKQESEKTIRSIYAVER